MQRAVTLWDGRVLKVEHALQLLLIIDFIFDWARDIYREKVIDSLLSLGQDVSESLLDDTDILTTYGGPSRMELDMLLPDTDEQPQKGEPFEVNNLLCLESRTRDRLGSMDGIPQAP